MLDVLEALHSSLDPEVALVRAWPLISHLIPADCAALCMADAEQPGGYRWVVVQLPRAFVDHYPELSTVDFVRDATALHANTAMREVEMLGARKVKGTALYQRCHDVDVRLEHVLGVRLQPAVGWHGGLTLYRLGNRPFTDEERRQLQLLTPHLVHAARNYRDHARSQRDADVLEAIFNDQGVGCVCLTATGTELRRTEHATRLLERWFTATEREPGRLPRVLVEPVMARASQLLELPPPEDFWRPGALADLRVSYRKLRETSGRWLWILNLREVPHALEVPAEWQRKLTPSQVTVAERVLRGWTNELISEDLGIAPATVKKHLQNIFDKIGVSSRAALISLATRLRS